LFLLSSVSPVGASKLQAVSGTIYVSHEVSNDVWALDASDGKVIAQIPVGKKPIGLWPSADYKRIFVPNEGSDSLSVIDVATNKVIADIALGKRPHDSLVTRDGSMVFVSDFGENRLHVLDAA